MLFIILHNDYFHFWYFTFINFYWGTILHSGLLLETGYFYCAIVTLT